MGRLAMLSPLCRAAVAAAAAALLPALLFAGEWPQWRGPRSDGSASGALCTGEPPDRLTRVWEREIGSGYSGPVLLGDRVWVHSRVGESEVVTALRLADGAEIWRRSYETPFQQDETARVAGRGPFATPAVAGGRLFTFSIDAVLRVWDTDTGRLLWMKASAEEFDPAFPYFGAAASPLVWRDLCFVHLGGHHRREMEYPSEGAMVALDVTDGRERWRWSGDGPAMGASPVVHEIAGQPQLVFKTKKQLVGLDPATGKELWRMRFPVPMDNTIVTPLFIGDRLFTSDYDTGITAWQIRRGYDSWHVAAIWRHRDVSLSMSTPVLAGGLLVGFSHLRRGQLFVLDPERGEVLWRGPARSGEHATLLSCGSRVLAIREDNDLLLAEVSRSGLETLKRFGLGRSVAYSHPAVEGDRIIYRDGGRLVVSRFEW